MLFRPCVFLFGYSTLSGHWGLKITLLPCCQSGIQLLSFKPCVSLPLCYCAPVSGPCLSVLPSVCPSVCLSFHLSVPPSLHLSVCLLPLWPERQRTIGNGGGGEENFLLLPWRPLLFFSLLCFPQMEAEPFVSLVSPPGSESTEQI